MKISILGTEYEIIHDETGKNPKLDDANGYCERYSKKIVLDETIGGSPQTIEMLEEFKKKVLRHEIIHGFFHESGMREYCEDEDLVDLLAVQIPKMIKTMREADCL